MSKSLRNETEYESCDRLERGAERMGDADDNVQFCGESFELYVEDEIRAEHGRAAEPEVDDVLGALLRLCERTTNVGVVAARHAVAQANALTRIALALERIADQVAPDTLTRKP